MTFYLVYKVYECIKVAQLQMPQDETAESFHYVIDNPFVMYLTLTDQFPSACAFVLNSFWTICVIITGSPFTIGQFG